MDLIRKIIITRCLETQEGKRKKNTDTQLGTKEAGGPKSAESKGTKKAQTGLTRVQFKKQWSIVSLRGHEVHLSELM
jgi:hypothetical protein